MIKIDGIIKIIDIETVPIVDSYYELGKKGMEIWQKWMGEVVPVELPKLYIEKASFYPEFAKVVCVCISEYDPSGQINLFNEKIEPFCGNNEIEILKALAPLLNSNVVLAGHNILNFDIPFLLKRYVMNGLPIPSSIDIAGLPPWKVFHIDTMKLWKVGDNYAKNISLDDLCFFLGVPSPKGDMDGSQVAKMAIDGQYDRIGRYCQKDIVAVADVLNVMTGKEIMVRSALA